MCDECDKGFATKASLNRHMKTHKGGFTYTCDYENCDWNGSDNQAAYIAHMASHSGKKPFQCKTCPKSFTTKQSLEKHEKGHGTFTRIKCIYENCKRTFKDMCYLNDHLRNDHGGEPYYCSVCDQPFRNRALRQKHCNETGHK